MIYRQKIIRTFLALLLALTVLSGCSQKDQVVDLGEIYNRSAKAHPIDRNPVILIPGIQGSRLVDSETGTVIWGTFGGVGLNPNTPLGLKLFSVPMQKGVPLNELTDSIVADGVLDSVQVRLAGLSFNLKAYYNIVSILGVGQYLDYDIAYRKRDVTVDYGDDHFTCFQFAYDWRLSIDENARLLGEFIQEKSLFVQKQIEEKYGIRNYTVKFDIIAHSMGGLLSRYFLRYGGATVESVDMDAPVPWTGAEKIDKLVMIGTPNAGSVKAVINFADGMIVGPLLPKFSQTLVGNIPAVYQLLPRNRHRRVIDANNPEKVIDIYDPDVWIKNHWGLAQADNDVLLRELLPDVSSPDQRKEIALDHLRKSLKKAESIAAALDRPASPPPSVGLYLFAGSSIETPATLAVDSRGKYTVFATECGDGIVVRSSTLLDERIGQTWEPRLKTPIEFDDVNFISEDHLGLTKDPTFSDNLLFLLLEQH